MKGFVAWRFYELATVLHPLRPADGREIKTVSFLMSAGVASMMLFRFHREEDPLYFKASIDVAKQLEEAIKAVTDEIVKSDESIHSVRRMDKLLTRFEIVLHTELSEVPLFCVEEQGNFSLHKLIRGASAGYPAKTKAKLAPDVNEEIDESGRCLAFTRPTASAFHILRALELVTKSYIVAAGLTMPPPNRCNWGEYISVLRSGSTPKEITDLLQMIKENYRNPIMHPDQVVDMDGAISLFGICQSAIEALCR